MSNDVTGIVLDIPPTVLDNIKKADEAITKLEQTSQSAAQNIKKHFDDTMVSGVGAFIQKVQEAQDRLGSLKMPTIDGSGLSAAVQALAQAMGTIDRSATTGSNRLGRIADAMTKLQTVNPDPILFQNIADGITKIGSTSQQTIDNVRNLSQTMAQLARDIRTVQTAQSAQASNTATAAQYNKLFKEQSDLVRRINEIKAKGADADGRDLTLLDKMRARYDEINQQLDKLNRKKQSAASELARTQGYNRVGDAQARTDAAGAINYAQIAKSLNELQAAYKNLKTVMATTEPKTAAWLQMNKELERTRTRIDEIKKKMGEFTSASRSSRDAVSALGQKIAAAFSVSAIQGYIEKLVQVRAQFELQNVALRAILQNKEEADRIFQQVQQMALQSPFTIMQLTTYAKQLAAYRVESEKLVGTTKMLADVSAGLGVDMQRLILAYGQVKSANYLRACLGKGVKVKMFDGTFKSVENVALGDVLMGDDEQPRHVSKLYIGEQQMYRVCYKGGEFRCNEHHILTVYDALDMRVSDVFVLDYLKEPLRYQGVRRINGEYQTFKMKVEKDAIDTYYGFSIDGNKRFIIENNIVTHNTEVRQFTEAGLNIAGELAQYFSELQGKMVSVGDVMEMITKRMVRFEDVEEVFKRVTSTGGLFYDMQRKQSETLFGQMQRIKDAISIMFNEIGKSNQGLISWVLTTIRSLISNWRTITNLIKAAALALGIFFATKKIAQFIAYWPTLLKHAMSFINFIKLATSSMAALKAAMASLTATGWGALITVVAALGYAIYTCFSNTSELKEAFEDIEKETQDSLDEAILNFHKLASEVLDVTKTYSEQEEALKSLKRAYGDMIDEHKLSREYLQGLNGDYSELTSEIEKYYQTIEYQKKREAVLQSEGFEDLKSSVWRLVDKLNEDKLFPVLLKKGMRGNIAGEIAKAITEGEIPATRKGIMEAISNAVGAGWNDTEMEAYGNRFALLVNAVYNDAKKVEGSLDQITISAGNAGNAVSATIEQAIKLGTELETNTADAALALFDATIANDAKRAADDFAEAVNRVHTELLNIYDDIGNLDDRALFERVNAAVGAANSAGLKFSVDAEKIVAGLKDAKTTYEFKQLFGDLLNSVDIAKAFEENKFSKLISREMSKAEESGSPLAKTVIKFAQQDAATYFKSFIQSMPKDLLPLFNTDAAKRALAGLLGQDAPSALENLGRRAETTSESLDKLYSERLIANAEKFEADAKGIDLILRKGADTPREMAKNLRKYAESIEEITGAYDRAPNKKLWLLFNGETKKSIKRQKAVSKTANALADEIAGAEEKKNKGRTEDKQLKQWQELKKTIEATSDSYEKYRAKYNSFTTNSLIKRQYGKIFEELGYNIEDFFVSGKYGAEQLVTALGVLKKMINATTTERKRFGTEVSRKIESQEVEIMLKAREDDLRKFKQDINAIFDEYELSKTIKDLGVDVNIIYSLGGKPTTLADIKKQLDDKELAIGGKEGSEDELKAIKDAKKKLADLEQKNAIERAKNYVKYLVESMGERAQIEIKALQDINKIRNDETLDAFSKEQAINERRKEMNEKLAKTNFDTFKSSDVYLNVFSDLERASKEQLRYVIKRLKELKETYKDLSPTQIKAITDEMSKAEKALSGKGFSFNIKKVIKYERERNELKQKQVEAQERIEEYEELITQKNKEIYESELKLKGIKDKTSDEYKEQSNELDKQRADLLLLQRMLDQVKKILEGITNDIDKGEEETDGLKENWEKIVKTLQTVLSNLTIVQNALEKMGALPDSVADAFSSTQDIVNSTITVGTGAIQALTDPDPWAKVGGAISAVAGIIGLIGDVFAIGDKKKERQIQRLQDKVEDLQRAYEKLGTAIEDAFTFDEYNAGYEKALKNIQEQRQAVNEQLALEESKKNSDKDKLQEYEDELDDLIEKEKELREARYEAMGSLSDSGVFDEAEDFVSVWLDAYKETGEGLDALTERWDEFFENLVLKQAASAVVSKRMQKYIQRINDAIDSNDTGLSLAQTFAKIGEELKNDLPNWDAELQSFFDALGIKLGQGDLLLSDLQQGIQNITEPQAAAIESYLNSMRFAVFEQNNILNKLLATIQEQYDKSNSTTILEEVKAIRALVSSVDNRLSRVIVPRNSSGSNYIMKVG